MSSLNDINDVIAKRFSKEALRQLTFIKILELLRLKLLDRSRVDDYAYVRETILNVHFGEGWRYRIYVDSHNEFVRQARLASKQKAKMAAVVLSFTAIEHVTNFYVRVFAELRGLSDAATDRALGSKHEDKLTWLAHLLGYKVDPEILVRINELRAVRNKVVHFTHMPMVATDDGEKDGSWEKVSNSLKKMRLSRYIPLADQLAQDLICQYAEAHPDWSVAERALAVLFKKK